MIKKTNTILLAGMILASLGVALASADPLPGPQHIYINVSNDDGVKWDWDSAYYSIPPAPPNNTYYMKCDGSGLNQLHFTTDNAVPRGQVTVSNNLSGVFYLTTTGGRGLNNDVILLISVKPPIPDDFAVHIRTSGYNWTPATPGAYNPPLPTDYYHVDNAIDETFTSTDFMYGPQTWKPGSGSISLPLYVGQVVGNTSSEEYLMFVDCYVGNLGAGNISALVDSGSVKVEYSFTNMTTHASFNAYGWCSAANQNEGISWTNDVIGGSSSGNSGYTVQYIPPLVANFTANVTSGTAPLTVRFTDESTGNPGEWAWDFQNDGTLDSIAPGPVFTYGTPGIYTVNLTVTNALGSDSEVKTGYITVEEPIGDRIAVFRDGSWYMDMNGDGSFTAADLSCRFGAAGWKPVVGDWNGNGTREIGVYLNGSWYLDVNGDGAFTGGDRYCSFGAAGWTPVVGDWNSDNTDEIGICRDGAWYLDVNGDGAFTGGDRYCSFGAAGWTPVVGDWDGDNATEIGIFRNGAWYLDMNGDGAFTGGDRYCGFGAAGWTPVVGDWDGDHTDEIGVCRDNAWYLDVNGDGAFTGGDRYCSFGAAGWTPVVGDWDGDRASEIGIYLNGAWYLDRNGNGIWDAGDAYRGFGAAGWLPVIW